LRWQIKCPAIAEEIHFLQVLAFRCQAFDDGGIFRCLSCTTGKKDHAEGNNYPFAKMIIFHNIYSVPLCST
jgi:hypothetical protein